MPSTLIIDPAAIENLRALSPDDGDSFLKEILTIFIDDTPARIAELLDSRAAGDALTFMRAAHSIKGSSSNVGASELRAIAEQLEHHAQRNGLVGVDAQVVELEAAFSRAREAIEKLMNG